MASKHVPYQCQTDCSDSACIEIETEALDSSGLIEGMHDACFLQFSEKTADVRGYEVCVVGASLVSAEVAAALHALAALAEFLPQRP